MLTRERHRNVHSEPDAGHEREPAAVPSHDLDDEGARVRGRRGGDAVDGLTDPMQRGRGANRQVGAGHVVVDLHRQLGRAASSLTLPTS